MANAPKMRDYLNEPSKEYFNQVLKGLDELGIPYKVEDRLVRGLDYYTNTVYEAVPIDDNGQQSTVFGGGQYDGLVESFGGGDLVGVGFGMGAERMISLALEQNKLQPITTGSDVYVISLGNTVGNYAAKLTNKLREAGIVTEMDYAGRSLKAQFKSADRFKAKAIIIIGEDEMNNNVVQIKDTINKTQETVNFEQVIEKVNEIIK